MAKAPNQKYATLKFKSWVSANSFKKKVGSNHHIKEKKPGVFSVRFKIDENQPLNSKYITNRLKYKN